MAETEGEGRPNENPSVRDSPSGGSEDRWRDLCKFVGWICASTGMTWEDVLDLPPLRLKFVARAIDRKRALDKLAIFDAKAALIDEKSLNRLNRELREVQM